MSKYSVNSSEGEFQAGSNDCVLKNLLEITSIDEMDEVELRLLNQLYENIFLKDLPNRVLTVEDIKTWHRRWLGNVYKWAGQERSVHLSKGDFVFAAAGQIPRLLAVFEKDCLQRWTPCRGLSVEDLIEGTAITHVELILIHPFREGNGRLARLLLDVMWVQAGKEPLDYSSWEKNKPEYFGAIHQGLARNYEPMKHWVRVAAGLKADGPSLPT